MASSSSTPSRSAPGHLPSNLPGPPIRHNFSGTWRLDRTISDNLDPLYKELGAGWLRRQRISNPSTTLIINHTPSQRLEVTTRVPTLDHTIVYDLKLNADRVEQEGNWEEVEEISGSRCYSRVEDSNGQGSPRIQLLTRALGLGQKDTATWRRDCLWALETRTAFTETILFSQKGQLKFVFRRRFLKLETPEGWKAEEEAENEARLDEVRLAKAHLMQPDHDTGEIPKVMAVGPWSWILEFAQGRGGQFLLQHSGQERPHSSQSESGTQSGRPPISSTLHPEAISDPRQPDPDSSISKVESNLQEVQLDEHQDTSIDSPSSDSDKLYRGSQLPSADPVNDDTDSDPSSDDLLSDDSDEDWDESSLHSMGDAPNRNDKASDYLTHQHLKWRFQARDAERFRQTEEIVADTLRRLSDMPPPHLYDLSGAWSFVPGESDDIMPLMELFNLTPQAQSICKRLQLQLKTLIWHSWDGSFCISERLSKPGLRLELSLGEYSPRPMPFDETKGDTWLARDGPETCDRPRNRGRPAILRNRDNPERVTQVYAFQRPGDADDPVYREIISRRQQRLDPFLGLSEGPKQQNAVRWAAEDRGCVIVRTQFPEDRVEIVDIRKLVTRTKMIQVTEVLDAEGRQLLRLQRKWTRLESNQDREIGELHLFPHVVRQRRHWQQLKDCERILASLRRKVRSRWARYRDLRQQIRRNAAENEGNGVDRSPMVSEKTQARRQWRLFEQQYRRVQLQFLSIHDLFVRTERSLTQILHRFPDMTPTFMSFYSQPPEDAFPGGGSIFHSSLHPSGFRSSSLSETEVAPADLQYLNPGIPQPPHELRQKIMNSSQNEIALWKVYLSDVDRIRLTTRIREMNNLTEMVNVQQSLKPSNKSDRARSPRTPQDRTLWSPRSTPHSLSHSPGRSNTVGLSGSRGLAQEALHHSFAAAEGEGMNTPRRRRTRTFLSDSSYSPAYLPTRGDIPPAAASSVPHDLSDDSPDDEDAFSGYMMMLYDQQTALRPGAFSVTSERDDVVTPSEHASPLQSNQDDMDSEDFGFFSTTPASFSGLWRCCEDKSDDMDDLYRLLGIGWWSRRTAKQKPEIQELQLNKHEFKVVRDFGKGKPFQFSLPPDGEWHAVKQWQMGEVDMCVYRDWMNDEISCEITSEVRIPGSDRRLIEVRQLQTYKSMKHLVYLYEGDDLVLLKKIHWTRIVE